MADDKRIKMLNKIRAIITDDLSEAGPLARFTEIKSILASAKVGYFLVIPPVQMCVHPKNRGGFGLNQHNAHRNIANIHKVGADFDLLTQACCTEMHPVGSAERALEVAFNDKLCVASNNMLAPVSGIERFCSLSTGHFAAGCKAAIAGCSATIREISDSNGKINLGLLKSDTNMGQMLSLGLEFFVIPHLGRRCQSGVPSYGAGGAQFASQHTGSSQRRGGGCKHCRGIGVHG